MYAHRWCLLTLLLIANVKVTACQNEMALVFLRDSIIILIYSIVYFPFDSDWYILDRIIQYF